jgi:hypothetical protein
MFGRAVSPKLVRLNDKPRDDQVDKPDEEQFPWAVNCAENGHAYHYHHEYSRQQHWPLKVRYPKGLWRRNQTFMRPPTSGRHLRRLANGWPGPTPMWNVVSGSRRARSLLAGDADHDRHALHGDQRADCVDAWHLDHGALVGFCRTHHLSMRSLKHPVPFGDCYSTGNSSGAVRRACLIQALERKRQLGDVKLADCRQCDAPYQRSQL